MLVNDQPLQIGPPSPQQNLGPITLAGAFQGARSETILSAEVGHRRIDRRHRADFAELIPVFLEQVRETRPDIDQRTHTGLLALVLGSAVGYLVLTVQPTDLHRIAHGIVIGHLAIRLADLTQALDEVGLGLGDDVEHRRHAQLLHRGDEADFFQAHLPFGLVDQRKKQTVSSRVVVHAHAFPQVEIHRYVQQTEWF